MKEIRPKMIPFIAALFFVMLAVNLNAQSLKVVSPESVGLSTERLWRIDKYMQGEIDQKRKAGMVVLVARHGSVAYHKAFGFKNIESGTKMTTDTIFRLASMTKPITSAALLTLYEEGKFQLSDPLEKYIPAFKDVKVFAGFDNNGAMILEAPKRKITIHDVFRHTPGFGNADGSPVGKLYREAGVEMSKVNSLKEYVERLATVPLLYHPGERWVYGPSHEVQAYLAEYFSGMPFDKYVQKSVLQPLGMKDTVFGVPKELVSRFANIHTIGKDGLQVAQPLGGMTDDMFNRIPSGGGGLSSTSTDYFQFAQMLLNGGKLGDVRILGKKTVELMRSNHLPPGVILPPAQGDSGYGLGVYVILDPAQDENLGSAGNFGWGGAHLLYTIIDPKEDMVALFFTQFRGD
jgi:CubicO group peptidase (beta-lactamase class C family)